MEKQKSDINFFASMTAIPSTYRDQITMGLPTEAVSYTHLWEADVLSDGQKQYAATDAWACLNIYNLLQELKQTGDWKYSRLLQIYLPENICPATATALRTLGKPV